ncbi:Tasp1 [Phodopus roborovskii]|uniref:Tasp1 protein n=1 Tax=Phodopus roborovskii TaxID=109678 RepID=A0AAU9Z5C9_PHORO|nr:Tasp1 [Phodopus roborovskii]
MTMEKGMSSGEGLPSRSPQASAAKGTVKESETRQPCEEKRGGFVLVHAGAGYHSESKAKEYKHVCKRACQKDSPFTNAGMGSNLNLLGEIECDASIMDGKSLNFGAVGALSGIKNPVSVANRLLCEGQKGKLSAGRIPPCFLVGEGAYRWAVDHGIPSCPPSIMTTRFSLAAFKRNKRKLELAERVETDFIQLKKRRQSSAKLMVGVSGHIFLWGTLSVSSCSLMPHELVHVFYQSFVWLQHFLLYLGWTKQSSLRNRFPRAIGICVFDLSHFDRCKMKSHSHFDLHFSSVGIQSHWENEEERHCGQGRFFITGKIPEMICLQGGV